MKLALHHNLLFPLASLTLECLYSQLCQSDSLNCMASQQVITPTILSLNLHYKILFDHPVFMSKTSHGLIEDEISDKSVISASKRLSSTASRQPAVLIKTAFMFLLIAEHLLENKAGNSSTRVRFLDSSHENLSLTLIFWSKCDSCSSNESENCESSH